MCLKPSGYANRKVHNRLPLFAWAGAWPWGWCIGATLAAEGGPTEWPVGLTGAAKRVHTSIARVGLRQRAEPRVERITGETSRSRPAARHPPAPSMPANADRNTVARRPSNWPRKRHSCGSWLHLVCWQVRAALLGGLCGRCTLYRYRTSCVGCVLGVVVCFPFVPCRGRPTFFVLPKKVGKEKARPRWRPPP